MDKEGISWSVLFFIVFIGLACAYLYNGPQWIWFLDDILHVMGGILACSFCLWDFRKENISRRTQSVLCLGFVALVSVLWEVSWYYSQEVAARYPGQFITPDDTMPDFLYALLGGGLRWVWYAIAIDRKKKKML